MKVFITWSGARSRKIAIAVKEFLEGVLDDVKCFMSDKDIEPGEEWLKRIKMELGESDIGILCLTPENTDARWLVFEAGFLMARATERRVVPLLHELETSLVRSPISTVQAKKTDSEEDLSSIVKLVNAKLNEPMGENKLQKRFGFYLPDLQKTLSNVGPIPSDVAAAGPRKVDELVVEVLDIVRGIDHKLSADRQGALEPMLIGSHLGTWKVKWPSSDPPEPDVVIEYLQTKGYDHMANIVTLGGDHGRCVHCYGVSPEGLLSIVYSKTRFSVTRLT